MPTQSPHLRFTTELLVVLAGLNNPCCYTCTTLNCVVCQQIELHYGLLPLVQLIHSHTSITFSLRHHHAQMLLQISNFGVHVQKFSIVHFCNTLSPAHMQEQRMGAYPSPSSGVYRRYLDVISDYRRHLRQLHHPV